MYALYVRNARHIRHARFRSGLLLMLILLMVLAACGGANPIPPPATSVSDASPDTAASDEAPDDAHADHAASGDEASGDEASGDAARGAELFTQVVNGAPACSTCHTTNGQVIVGPSFQGYSDVAGARVEGQTAEEYTHASIIHPSEHVVDGFVNAMYNQYERSLSEQDIANLVAYLLTL